MRILIACGAMPFGPKTTNYKSLGGSETAALESAKALAARGHEVILFCKLPQPPEPDAWPHDAPADGVLFKHLDAFQKFAAEIEHDLLIAVRDPAFVATPTKSKKKVLWMHDIATKRGYQRIFDQMGWCFDEIWAVSDWYRHQINEATGFPLSHIVALRNGIVKVPDIMQTDRMKKQIIYCARPERGLENLIMPGGVMEYLPDYKLVVAMYAHFPDHMKEFYERIFARMKQMPNVEFVGGKSQPELRQMIRDSAAYIYPTQFEETSCIIARECVEQGTPMLTTRTGALEETLGHCGVFFEDWLKANGIAEPEKATRGWCKLFALFFRECLNNPALVEAVQGNMRLRKDLYWDGVAEMMEANAQPRGPVVQKCAAAVIAMNNADTILKMLRSLEGNVDFVQIALGPCTDNTRQIALDWYDTAKIPVQIVDVPRIEAGKFGFDDARNASIEGLRERGMDWAIWIDTDEYLSAPNTIRHYLRNNHLDSYIIPQHHFTVEPRGRAAEIDRPARLIRLDRGFKANGHIHEHFEVPEGGPGRAIMLPDVDLGHPGYTNEVVRKARFDRNLPFLKWDHASGTKRKLHYFLWFRDLVHQMRFEFKSGNREKAHALALEAKSYYNEHVEDMAAFGPGMFHALQYIGEINALLGVGVPMQINIKFDDRETTFASAFDDYAALEKVMRKIVETEMKERKSRYW